MLKLARRLAEKCDGKYKVVAIVTDKKGRVVSTGTNSYRKTHPWQASLAQDCGVPRKTFLHAEVSALLRARGKGYKLSVSRFDVVGRTRMAAPCAICQRAAKKAGIRLIEYTT